MRKMPLFVAVALTISVPLLAIRADEVQEETPGTSEYFTKYVEGRFGLTNGQMVSTWNYPKYDRRGLVQQSFNNPHLVKGRVVQVIEPGKVLVAATEERDTYLRRPFAFHRPTILLTAPADTYTQGEQVALWGLLEADFACVTDDGQTNTVSGYRTPVPGAITVEQYKTLIAAGVKTPDRVSMIATCVPLPSREDRTRVHQAEVEAQRAEAAAQQQAKVEAVQQARNDNAEAWNLATSPITNQQNGAKAVTLALQATAVRPDELEYLDTLAAAYARSGEFDKAIVTQEKAIQIGSQPKQRPVIRFGRNNDAEFQARLDLYKQGLPYTRQITSAERSAQDREDLEHLTPEALRTRLAELEAEKRATEEASMSAYREYAAAETALQKAEGAAKDSAAIIYQQAKDKNQLANQKVSRARNAMDLAISILAGPKDSAPSIPEPNESNKADPEPPQ